MIAQIKGIRAFVPSSQISSRYTVDSKAYLGKEFNFNIIEFDPVKKKLVIGRKDLAAQEEKEIKERVLGKLEIGQQVKGKVSRIIDFGAFVDLGGIDGLIHISQLSWSRVKHVSEIINEGDEITAVVIDLDKDKNKVSLSLRDRINDPWQNINERYKIGDVITGTVLRVVQFGAFVEIEPGLDGLLHISQISTAHVKKTSDVIAVGDVVTAKIHDINAEKKRISLSIRELMRNPKNAEEQEEQEEQNETQAQAEMEEQAENK